MSLEQPPFHSHFQEGHFATSFTALDQLRKEDVLTDITLVAAENLSCLPVRTVRAHKLVLMAVSDYFRTMFKACYTESRNDTIVMPGVESELLEPLVEYFYTGKISISSENVLILLQASSLLLLPCLVKACGQFLSINLDESNCLDILSIASTFNYGEGLVKLEADALRYIQLHFETIWRSQAQLAISDGTCLPSEDVDEDLAIPKMDCLQLSKLLNTDDLCVDSEDSVFSCINFWLQSCNNSSNSNSKLIKDSDLINLWETVRFSHLSSDMMTQVVEKSEFFETIKKTESYQHTTLGSAMRAWSRSARRRGHNLEVVVAHADGHADLEYLNTVHESGDHWSNLTSLPDRCGLEGVAISGYRSRVFVVGGNSPLLRNDNKQGKTCFFYDLNDNTWSRSPSLQQSRWGHGLVRMGDTLYAVAGCGQQNSMEALSLTDLESGWAPRPSMGTRRHVPGVGVLDGLIYVVGGADDQWNANVSVECFHPGENIWTRLPDIHCPRAQPAVQGHQGLLYVMGGRNSKKVELKSIECYDPATNAWTLLDGEGGTIKKRWGAASVELGQDNILLIGGRGKWVSNSVEVFDSRTRQWLMAGLGSGLGGHDKRYTACLVTRPNDRWGMTLSDK